MLYIDVVLQESFDDETSQFVSGKTYRLELEHSLVSLSKWESFFEKPFLSSKEKTSEEVVWYVRAMTVDPNVPPEVFAKLNQEHIDKVQTYLAAKMTATTVSDDPSAPRSREVITSELIYYWLISMQIPFECQYWHLNRLLTLIKVCQHKNKSPKNMSKAELARRNRELNAKRRAQYGTKG